MLANWGSPEILSEGSGQSSIDTRHLLVQDSCSKGSTCCKCRRKCNQMLVTLNPEEVASWPLSSESECERKRIYPSGTFRQPIRG